MQDILETNNIHNIFSQILLKNDPSLYLREEQLHLSQTILNTIEQGGSLIAEAGTGVGKSFAYSIPALLYAQRGYGVVIITATITLQHQLYEQDIPRLQTLLQTEVPVTVLKGKQNYLCKHRAVSLLQTNENNIFDVEGMKELQEWIHSTTTGDKEELAKHYVVSPQLWQDICTDPYSCGGAVCARKQNAGCFYNEAKKKTQHAGIIITNYSMLAVHLRNVLQQSEKTDTAKSNETQLLPENAIYVLDEAHKLSTIIRDGLGESISEYEMHQTHESLIGKHGVISEMRNKQGALQQLQVQAISLYEKQFAVVGQYTHAVTAMVLDHIQNATGIEKGTVSNSIHYNEILDASDKANDIVDEFVELSKHIDVLIQQLEQIKKTFQGELILENTIQHQCLWWRRQQALSQQFSELDKSQQFIRWCESQETKKQKILTFNITQLNVNDVLSRQFFERIPISICTSATLSASKSFDFWKQQSGAPSYANTVQLPSPFPYSERVLFAIPNDAPNIQAAIQYENYLRVLLPRLIQLVEGKTLILCTSNAMVRTIGKFLRQQLQQSIWNILVQDGSISTPVLAKQFREDIHSVLVATNSFWEGFDAPGETLRLLVLTRIPFVHPNNLFFKEEQRILEEYGYNSFTSLALPQAEIRLRQGFGRLMRGHDDGGVVFISDNRMLSKGYGNKLISTLPHCKTCFQSTNVIFSEMKKHLLSL